MIKEYQLNFKYKIQHFESARRGKRKQKEMKENVCIHTASTMIFQTLFYIFTNPVIKSYILFCALIIWH